MQKQNIDFEQVHDIIAFRIILDSIQDCYATLGIVHSLWTPVPGRIKDYIAIPKLNGYQSLHTTVIGPENKHLEIQIRTQEMHKVAEEGIAAHWIYKEGAHSIDFKDEKKFGWLRQLIQWQKELEEPMDFIDAVKIDLFEDEVYVFTPKGDLIVLPRYATPVDFAFAIHTELGLHCSGARVNGRLVPLRYQLRTGDTVEVLTSPHQRPSKDWLDFVVSSRANIKIRHYLKTIEQKRSASLGREILERKLKDYNLSLNKILKNGEIDKIIKKVKGINSKEELFSAIGYGKIEPSKIISFLVPKSSLSKDLSASKLTQTKGKIKRHGNEGIKVQGIEDVLIRFAKCCSPVMGDEVIGFITRGRGITIHRIECPKILSLDSNRRIEVEWQGKPKLPRLVNIKVVTIDRPGILGNIGQSFSSFGINISEAVCKTTCNNRAISIFQVQVIDLHQLNTALRALQKVKGVYSVERVLG
jgi:GTP pyrophosphokinase